MATGLRNSTRTLWREWQHGLLAAGMNACLCAWQVAQVEEPPEEPEEAACTVCKEGYASAPQRLLCAYVHSKREPAGSFPAAAPPGAGPDKMVASFSHGFS